MQASLQVSVTLASEGGWEAGASAWSCLPDLTWMDTPCQGHVSCKTRFPGLTQGGPAPPS